MLRCNDLLLCCGNDLQWVHRFHVVAPAPEKNDRIAGFDRQTLIYKCTERMAAEEISLKKKLRLYGTSVVVILNTCDDHDREGDC